ncbi:MAG: hypothetical protein JWO82_3026, partial [Akkermansiaceae bacterium]|nr:hypothetical protein [Akkermansiaceae bacterium]
NDETRRFLLLQNASFLPLFRNDAEVKDGFEIDRFEPLAPGGTDAAAVADIFSGANDDKMAAARKTFSYLQTGGDPKAFMDTAQRLIYMKGTDAHDYKFSTAVIEDYQHLSPAVRNRFLAASVYWLKSSADRDNPLVARSRAAL